MGLLDRMSAANTVAVRDESRFSIDTWLSEYLIPSQFQYGGNTYPLGLTQTLAGNRAAEIVQSLPGYMSAVQGCPPAFAAQMVRALVLSQARFTFRNPPWHPRTPRRTFGNGDLQVLEKPWKNATTGELVGRMEWHAGLAGNSFVFKRPDRMRVLRPDWTAILYGSELEPDNPGHALDGDLLGYVYWNGGPYGEFGYKPRFLLPDEVAHWAPIPDPLNAGIGMSWLTPAIRDLQGDRLAAEHKIRFFENGATPNLVVKGLTAQTKEKFQELVDMMEENHAGVANAYRTLYLTAGADATVVGSDLSQIDFKSTVGAGETRISVLSRVPASLLGISEGLAGSSLNAGNFSAARRSFADSWVYPSLQDLAASLAPLVNVPADAELWTDVADIPLLREDAKDAAEIEQIKGGTIRQLVDGGFDPDSVVAAVTGQNMSLLKHTGLVSVQMQTPGSPGEASTGKGAPAPAAAPTPSESNASDAARLIQQIYLGVGKVITVEEARQIVNQASGVDLSAGVDAATIFADLPPLPSPADGAPAAPKALEATK